MSEQLKVDQTPTPEQQQAWNVTREQDSDRASWMAHGEKLETEAAMDLDKLREKMENEGDGSHTYSKKFLGETAGDLRSFANQNAKDAGRRYDLQQK